MKTFIACSAGIGLTAVVACGGGSTVVDVTAYDQTCQADSDCVVVQDGDICCGCPDAAINAGALPRYEADLGECDAQCDIGCPSQMVAVCDGGTCRAREVQGVCEPGATTFCKCAAGSASGTKTCLPDGSGFADCSCP